MRRAHTPDLTVIHVVGAPGMQLFPHNHLMWAAIGIYAGQEDNTFYRRTGPGAREERPYAMDLVDAQFAEANREWHETTAETPSQS